MYRHPFQLKKIMVQILQQMNLHRLEASKSRLRFETEQGYETCVRIPNQSRDLAQTWTSEVLASEWHRFDFGTWLHQMKERKLLYWSASSSPKARTSPKALRPYQLEKRVCVPPPAVLCTCAPLLP